MARLAIGRNKQGPSGNYRRLGLGHRRDRRSNPELHERLDRIPSVHSMNLELIPVGAGERKEVGDGRILRDPIGQHDQPKSAGDGTNV
jgi:hypothetical protein